MFLNYLKIAFKRVRNNPGFALTILFGLTMGITAAILLYAYIDYEKNYDSFYENHESIYRISYSKYLNGALSEHLAKSPEALASTVRDEMPEARAVTQFYPLEDITIGIGHEKFSLSNALWVDSYFAQVFSPDFVNGSLIPGGFLISESLANTYFGSPSKAINQTMVLMGQENLSAIVTGVYKDIPDNTHLHYDMLFVENGTNAEPPSWQWTGVYTYVLLNKNVLPAAFETDLNHLVAEKTKGLFEYNITTHLGLQPVTRIHLHSNLQEELQPNASHPMIVMLQLIGIILLAVAIFNAANLYAVNIMERGKEMGVRKVLGNNRWGLVKQFFVEAAFYNLISVIVAIALVVILIPYLAQFSGKTLTVTNIMGGFDLWGLSAVLVIGGTTAFLVYPMLAIGTLHPMQAIKGEMLGQPVATVSARKIMITLQVSATLFIMMAAVVIFRQLQFMQAHQLGMDIDHLVVIKAPDMEKETWSDSLMTYLIDSGYYGLVRELKQNLADYHAFSMASVSHIPGKELVWGTEGFRREGADPEEVHSLYMQGIDYDFLEVFGITLAAGRNFDRDHISDQLDAVLINQSAVQELGFLNPEDAVGKNLIFYDGTAKTIVGVVGDFHQESLKKSIKPAFFQLLPRALNYLAVKIPGRKVQESVSFLQNQWQQVFTGSPFNYFFLDEFYNAQYKNEAQFLKVSTLFAILCIIISNVGLFGLSTQLIARRTREISIRKVLGAEVKSLVTMLSRGQLILLLVGFLIACPAGYLVLNHWLNNFAFRTELSWWLFTAPFIASLLFTTLIVGSLSLKYALKNPVEVLRSE